MIDRTSREAASDERDDRVHDAPQENAEEPRNDNAGTDDQPAARRDVIDLASKEDEQHSDGDADGQEDTGKPNSKGEKAASDGQSKENDDNPPKPPPKMVFIIAGLILLGFIGWGGYGHWRSYQASKQTTDDTVNRPVEVRTTEAKRLDQPVDLTLPGETQAFDSANIFPRATGYVAERRVDIGTRVKQGDLLIHIASPDLDQQLEQAQAQMGQTRASLTQAVAQVSQASANLNLANVNFARTNQLTQQGYETQQNHDQRLADVQTQQANVEAAKAGERVADANIKAQQANIDRLKALAAFEDVRAPFDGVITARNVDLGELVNADSTTGSPIFTIVRDSTIRVIVRVPQSAAEGIHPGLEAKVIVSQMPGRSFAGRVQRSSVALLYSSRTLTTEVDVPNEAGDLRPGLYVSVSFSVPREINEVSIPAEALMFDQHGMRVASLDGDIVKLNTINIARDHGTTVDLRKGLQGGERIVLNPPATLKDGAKVKEIREEDEKKADEDDKAKNAPKAEGGKADQTQQAQAKSGTDNGTK